MCDLSYEETATVYKVTRVKKARKPHLCATCRRTIKPGEGYERHAMLYDGEWDDADACAECAADIAEFGKAHRFTPFPDGAEYFIEGCIDGDDQADKRWREMLERIDARRRSARESESGASTPHPEGGT